MKKGRRHLNSRERKLMNMSAAEMRCAGKDRYVSERIAGIRAQQVGDKRGVRLYHYECRHCDGWHLTKINPQEYAMRKEPKIGTKGPMKVGGTGGGLSQPAVKLAMQPKAPAKVAAKKMELPKAVDTKRNDKAMREMK